VIQDNQVSLPTNHQSPAILALKLIINRWRNPELTGNSVKADVNKALYVCQVR